MVSFKELKNEVVKAMKAKDTQRKDLFRLLVSQIENDRLKYGAKSVDELTPENVEKGIRSFVKGLEKEKETFASLGKSTQKVDTEIQILSELLPKQVTGNELKKLVFAELDKVENVSMKSIGHLKKVITVPVDFKEVSGLVKEYIAN